VIDECLAFVDDVGREVFETQSGNELPELHGKRFIQHPALLL
jgi:hypothetical protein